MSNGALGERVSVDVGLCGGCDRTQGGSGGPAGRRTLALEERVSARTAELARANEALERANAELRTLSQSDGLTGIGNRRLFGETLEREWARSAREEQHVSVILLDVDFFKQFNDSCGHVEGDAALVRVAECLKDSVLRPADLVARYGGEEFVVLLPNTDEVGALRIADRIETAISKAAIVHPSSSVSRYLTVSMGVAAGRPADGDSGATDLVELADRALYAAKEAGRNRLFLADELD